MELLVKIFLIMILHFKKIKTIINKENLLLLYYNYIILIFKILEEIHASINKSDKS